MISQWWFWIIIFQVEVSLLVGLRLARITQRDWHLLCPPAAEGEEIGVANQRRTAALRKAARQIVIDSLIIIPLTIWFGIREVWKELI